MDADTAGSFIIETLQPAAKRQGRGPRGGTYPGEGDWKWTEALRVAILGGPPGRASSSGGPPTQTGPPGDDSQ